LRATVVIRESTRSRQRTAKTLRAWTALRACTPPVETRQFVHHASKAGLRQTMVPHWGAVCALAESTASLNLLLLVLQMRPAPEQMRKTAAGTALPGLFQISTAFPLQKIAPNARPASGAMSRAPTRSRCANLVRPDDTLRRRAPSQRATAPCALPGDSPSLSPPQVFRPALNVPVDSHRRNAVLSTAFPANQAPWPWRMGRPPASSVRRTL
jgi:hypothetical protein